MRGRLTGLSLSRDGMEQNITVTVAADFSETYDELKDYEVEVEIKKAAKHRSIEANAYCWTLIDQITRKLQVKEPKAGWKKETVYRNAIREIGGVSKEAYMMTDAVPVFRRIWEKQGLGNQVEVISDEPETGWCSVMIWFGSSTYDSQQMSQLINVLIQDAEALGIPTITPKEEEKMLQRWGRKMEGKHNGNDHDSRDDHAGKGAGVPETEHGQLPEDQQGQSGTVCGRNESGPLGAER